MGTSVDAHCRRRHPSPALGGDRRVVRRCDRGDHPGWHGPELESWRRGALRVLGRGDAGPEDRRGRSHRIAPTSSRRSWLAWAAGEHVHHYETVRRHKNGSVLDVSVTISPILDTAGETVSVSTIERDITPQKRMQQLLAHRALHDALTNLPNRVLLRDRIEGALARAQRDGSGVAVLFLDLDGFKVLNDTHGHAAGDEILRVVAERLRAAVRTDDTVARFGGDEFVIVCHDIVNEERAGTIAQRVAAAVAVPVSLHGRDVVVHASIGVVLGRPGAVPDVLVHDADTAMYDAKHNSRAFRRGRRRQRSLTSTRPTRRTPLGGHGWVRLPGALSIVCRAGRDHDQSGHRRWGKVTGVTLPSLGPMLAPRWHHTAHLIQRFWSEIDLTYRRVRGGDDR